MGRKKRTAHRAASAAEMAEGDHYQTLGLRRDASKADVKAAFSRLALLHHPDRHVKADAATRAEATRRFRLVYDAYHVLYDDLRRAEYDLLTSSSSSSSSGYGHGGAKSSSSASRGYGHRGAKSSSSASSGYGHRGAKSSSSAPSDCGHCGAKSSSSDPSGYGQHGDASPSPSASDIYGNRYEYRGGYQNWPSPRGSESLGVWVRANWFPLLCCATEVARALIDVVVVVADACKLYNSWKSSMESIETEAQASKEKEAVESEEKTKNEP